MTVAVIGSNCFTGSHIVDSFLADGGQRVIGIGRAPEAKALYLPYKARDLSRFMFKRFDLVTQPRELQEFLAAERPAVVVNVAALSEVALSHERPAEYFETNTVAVARLADFLRRQSWLERYAHISSAEIFGSCARPAGEETLFNPSTPYAASKAAADMYLNTLIRHFGFRATLIRSTNVYGAHQQLFKIIPRAIINVKLGRTIELHGGGTARKCFVHVRDVAAGLRLALAQGGSGAYHFSVASPDSVADVVRLICRLLGADFEKATRVVGERLGQDAAYALDCARAERELVWAPRVRFEEGVRETIAWIERHFDEIRAEPQQYAHRVSAPGR